MVNPFRFDGRFHGYAYSFKLFDLMRTSRLGIKSMAFFRHHMVVLALTH